MTLQSRLFFWCQNKKKIFKKFTYTCIIFDKRKIRKYTYPNRAKYIKWYFEPLIRSYGLYNIVFMKTDKIAPVGIPSKLWNGLVSFNSQYLVINLYVPTTPLVKTKKIIYLYSYVYTLTMIFFKKLHINVNLKKYWMTMHICSFSHEN